MEKEAEEKAGAKTDKEAAKKAEAEEKAGAIAEKEAEEKAKAEAGKAEVEEKARIEAEKAAEEKAKAEAEKAKEKEETKVEAAPGKSRKRGLLGLKKPSLPTLQVSGAKVGKNIIALSIDGGELRLVSFHKDSVES